jgi:hypothetical protein
LGAATKLNRAAGRRTDVVFPLATLRPAAKATTTTSIARAKIFNFVAFIVPLKRRACCAAAELLRQPQTAQASKLEISPRAMAAAHSSEKGTLASSGGFP